MSRSADTARGVRHAVRARLAALAEQYVGEGFDCPPLDTLLLTFPISVEIVLRHLRVPTVVLAAVLLLAACDGGGNDAEDGNGAGSQAGGDLTFEATEFEFAPAQTDSQPGETTITMDNVGEQPHTWTIEGMEDAILIDAAPGQTETGTVDSTAATTPTTATYPATASPAWKAPSPSTDRPSSPTTSAHRRASILRRRHRP